MITPLNILSRPSAKFLPNDTEAFFATAPSLVIVSVLNPALEARDTDLKEAAKSSEKPEASCKSLATDFILYPDATS